VTAPPPPPKAATADIASIAREAAIAGRSYADAIAAASGGAPAKVDVCNACVCVCVCGRERGGGREGGRGGGRERESCPRYQHPYLASTANPPQKEAMVEGKTQTTPPVKSTLSSTAYVPRSYDPVAAGHMQVS
jgi:hypothetical protein